MMNTSGKNRYSCFVLDLRGKSLSFSITIILVKGFLKIFIFQLEEVAKFCLFYHKGMMDLSNVQTTFTKLVLKLFLAC